MSDEEIDIAALEKRMEGALQALRTEFASLRTGRASASMLDPVMVEAYGSTMPVNQLGTITVPEPRLVLVNIWDKALVNTVDKAIRNSGLGINPQMDGTILRLPIPELNEERRRELAKVAGQYAEHARVAVRNVRRDGMDQLKKARAAGMGEDDEKLWHDEIQELTDASIRRVDAALTTKQADVAQVGAEEAGEDRRLRRQGVDRLPHPDGSLRPGDGAQIPQRLVADPGPRRQRADVA